MAKITYHESRPGRWIKLVDGKYVGVATAEEVAAWKREKAAPGHIWEDVVATASRPPSGEVATASRPPADEAKTATSPPVTAGAPAEPTTSKEPDESVLWEDLVKRSKPSVKPEGPPEPHPREEDTDQAEQAQIWQDVLQRAKRPGPPPERQPAQEVPISATTAEAKPEPASGASLAPAASPAKAAHPAPVSKPVGEGTGAKKAFEAEIAARGLTAKPLKPAVEAKAEEEAAPVRKVPDAKPVPEPVPPGGPVQDAGGGFKLTAVAEGGPRTGPGPEVSAAKPTKKAKAAVRAAPARKKRAPSRLPKPAAKDRLPVKLLDEIAGEESKPAVAPAEQAVIPAGRRQVSPSRGRGKVSPSRGRGKVSPSSRRGKVSPPTAPRRGAGKGKAAPAQERPNQSYLWISAGQADDVIAVVRTGLARYQERFSHVAEVVLCHSADLPALEEARLPVDLREGKSLARRNFWIGLK